MTLSTPRKPALEIPTEPSPAQYQRLARELRESDDLELEPIRIALLSSFTLDFLRPVLIVEGARVGLDVDPYVGPFGQLEQPVLDEGSELDGETTDVLVLNFQPGDLNADALDRHYQDGGGTWTTLTGELTYRLLHVARTFRDRYSRPVLIANFATPPHLPLGPLDASDPNSLTHQIAGSNKELAARVSEEADIYVWDYAGLVRESGSLTWSDERLRMLARVAVSSGNQPAMAKHLLRTVSALRKRPAKCLVLDLDNTLWGGVVGDDGPGRLQLGDDWPGTPFKAFQRTVLGLRDRGVLLAVVSKNDESVASQVFKEHPEMLIAWEDLAAARVNWNVKSANMREIADELNIGTDALVLFDDNPVERAEVRANLPESTVIDVPADPTDYRRALLQSGCFDQLSLSKEDLGRAEMYRVERARTSLRQEAPSLQEFLEGLQMTAEVGEADPETLGRVAQLVGKTNQFNLTTRRHSRADIAAMAHADDTAVAWLRLADRFGDQGLVAVGIGRSEGDDIVLDTLLMSCRVMNRGVEQAFVAYLGELASRLGGRHLIGEYLPTKRNHMVKDLFPSLGFQPLEESDAGSRWRLDVSAAAAMWPPHIGRVSDGTKDGR